MEPGRGQAAPAEQQTNTGFLEEILLGTIFLLKAGSGILRTERNFLKAALETSVPLFL